MEINIGRGPDYILMRGREVLSYRFEVELFVLYKCIKQKSYVNRSLAMVVKDARQFIGSLLDVSTGRFGEISSSDDCIKVYADKVGTFARFTLIAPDGMKVSQSKEIAENFAIIFRKHRSLF